MNASPRDPSAAADETPASVAGDPRKPWRVGTLAYSTAGLVALFFWLLWGDFAWSLKERSVWQVLQLVLRRFDASDTTAGVMIGALPALLTILVGPVISYRSDRHRGRWGRRIPYLLVATPVAAVSICLMAASPAIGRAAHRILGGHSPGENHLVIASFAVFWATFEAGTVAAQALYNALINDVVPHRFLGRFFGLFRAISLLAGIGFNYYLLGYCEAHYAWMFVGIGVVYGIGFLVMCLNVREGGYPPPAAADERSPAGRSASVVAAVGAYCRECFRNPYYLWVFLALNVAQLCFMPINLFSTFFAKSVNMDMGLYGKYIAFSYAISLLLAYFLGILADRFHPLRVGMVTLGCYAVVTLLGGLYATDAARFGIAFVAHVVLSGVYFTVSASLPLRLFPKSRFAQFWSAAEIVRSACTIALSWGVGFYLDHAGHAYRHTYYMSAGLSIACLASFLVVYRYFVRYGGPANYVAPE